MRTKILRGMGGGDETQDDKMDLMEMVAILLIPTLLKCANDGDLPDGVIKPSSNLIRNVLEILLHDTTNSRNPKKLNRELISRIFLSYGEVELAENYSLVNEMLEVATTPEGMMDEEAFTKALTSDVQLYDIENESRLTTNFEDVFGAQPTKGNLSHEQPAEVDAEVGGSNRETEQNKAPTTLSTLNRRSTFSAIDTTAGTYRSKMLIVTLWASFVVTYFAFYSGPTGIETICEELDNENKTLTFQYGRSWTESSDAIGCAIGRSVVRWLLIFTISTAYGLFFIGLGSLGNDLECRHWWYPLIAILAVSVESYAIYYTPTGNHNLRYLKVVTLILSTIASCMQLLHLAILLVPKEYTERHPQLKRLFATQSMVHAAKIKKATAYKLDQMVRNAVEMACQKDKDSVLETHFGQGLMNYTKSRKMEYVGGIRWTWQRIKTGELFWQDGIWLSSRLVYSNIAQVVVTIFVLIAGITLTQYVSDEFNPEVASSRASAFAGALFDSTVDPQSISGLVANVSAYFSAFLAEEAMTKDFIEEQCNDRISATQTVLELGNEVCTFVGGLYECEDLASPADYLCALANNATNLVSGSTMTAQAELLNLGLLNASGLDVDALLGTARTSLQTATETSVENMYPSEPYMVVAPFAVGTVIAFITAVSLAVTYIPSVTSTTLKLRSGVIPSLHDAEFNRYRFAQDTVTIITGSMFWGCFLSSLLMGGIIGLIVFLFVWQVCVF